MNRLVLLHTNDVHGRIEGLARVATLVERIREEEDAPVLYLDAGDVEETTVRLSNLTKGAVMHRVLSAAGCDASVVGNGAWLRYGTQVLAEHAEAASYPLLLANLRPVEGVLPSVVLEAGSTRVGLIGVTDPFPDFLGMAPYGIESLEVVPLVRGLARELRAGGADLVVVLSHLGWENARLGLDDRLLAGALDGEVELVIGAHSHSLLLHGERVGGVLVAQAGSFAEHLGRIDVSGRGLEARVLPVPEETPQHPAVLAAASEAERRLGAHLDEVVARLDGELDAGFVAEVFRVRMDADVGLATEFANLDEPLPAGELTRGRLWEVCRSTGNPGVVELTGAQLSEVLRRADDPDFRASTAQALRGRPRGRLFVSGLDGLDAARTYRVAGTDWELEPYGGMVDPGWRLRPQYDFPTIVREAVEEHLRRSR